MSIATSVLWQRLQPHWESVQTNNNTTHEEEDGDDDDDDCHTAHLRRLCDRAETIVRLAEEYALEEAVANVSLTTATNNVSSSTNDPLLDCLRHALDCAIATESCDASAMRVCELVVAVVTVRSKGHSSSNHNHNSSDMDHDLLLQRLLTLASTAPSDKVRTLATHTLGVWTETAVTIVYADTPHVVVTVVWPTLWETVQQTLLARCTDTSVKVRAAAVRTVLVGGEKDRVTAALWMLAHDASPVNRVAAIRAVTTDDVAGQTIDHLVARVRDTHGTVRVAALEALHRTTTTTTATVWQPHHRAALVGAGWNDRCSDTKEATYRLICLSWIKQANYDPVQLLQTLDVLDHPTAGTSVLEALHRAIQEITSSSSSFLDLHWSDAERQALVQGWAEAATVSNLADVTHHDAERLFLARHARAHQTTNEWRMLLSTASSAGADPMDLDVTVLCQGLERAWKQLVDTYAKASSTSSPLALKARGNGMHDDDDDAMEDTQERLIFLCTQLLQLVDPATLEEGSRRVFVKALQALLSHVLTPDDLLEPCVTALLPVRQRGDTVVTDILSSVTEQIRDTRHAENAHDDDSGSLEINFLLRSLAILSLVLELDAPESLTSTVVQTFAPYIVPATSHAEALVRQAAVSCLGKLGLCTAPDRVRNDYYPILLKALVCETEASDIRLQAGLGLTDWTLLGLGSPGETQQADFCSAVSSLLAPGNSVATRMVAAEIAVKLLAADHVCLPDWYAQLLVFFFDESLGDEDDDSDAVDVTSVGNPIRLRQLLAVFFPVAAHRSERQRDAMVASLGRCVLRQHAVTRPLKKLVPKLIDYVVATARDAERHAANQTSVSKTEDSTKEDNDDGDVVTSPTPRSSPGLLVAVQLATYLTEGGSEETTTYQRALCKIIANTPIVMEDELWEHLSLLAELVEELVESNVIEDPTCRRSLQSMIDQLEDVEKEEQVNDDDDADSCDDLVNAVQQISLAVPSGTVDDDTAKEYDMQDTESSVDGERRDSLTRLASENTVESSSHKGSAHLSSRRSGRRRLRPSN